MLVYEYIGMVKRLLDCFKNNSKLYLRIVEGKYYKCEDNYITVKNILKLSMIKIKSVKT